MAVRVRILLPLAALLPLREMCEAAATGSEVKRHIIRSEHSAWQSISKDTDASRTHRTYGQACGNFLTQEKNTNVGSAILGEFGNAWSPCTHLKNYGLNFAPFVARFLAYQLAPQTALEFGCGLGTTSDFVARFGGTQVTCIEPESTLGGLIMSLRKDMKGNGDLQQLALNVFSEEDNAKQCISSGDMRSDLVYSFEVAEHIPHEFHPKLVQLLVNSTKKWLVFSAARPDQLGTGHLPDSMMLPVVWRKIFEDAGLVFMPQLTLMARHTAYPLRSYDLFSNILVFKTSSNPAKDTDTPHEMLSLFQAQWGVTDDQWEKRQDLEAFAKGSNSALWPTLTALETKVRKGDMCQQTMSLAKGHNSAMSSELAFESAWGAHFYREANAHHSAARDTI